MKRGSCFRTCLWVLVLAFQVPDAHGATAADYVSAGSRFYAAKDYSQAILQYDAALGMDPGNGAALLGRGNCYYFLGRYQEALADYQGVKDPSPQLTQWIETVRAKAGNAPSVPAPAAGPFEQGVALYRAKNYQESLSYFQQAIRQDPQDYRPHYYLGASHAALGNLREAALYLSWSDQRKPDPAIRTYVGQLRMKLSPEGRQWVDDQLAASVAAGSIPVARPVEWKKFGIRLKGVAVLVNLADFDAQARGQREYFRQLQAYDPNLQFSAAIPTGYPHLTLEPVLRLAPNFELSFPLAFGDIGACTENFTSSVFGSGALNHRLTALFVGANAGLILGTGAFQFFVSGGPSLAIVNDDYYRTQGANSLTAQLSSPAFGGQLQAGLDFHVTENFTLGPVAGGQFAIADNFTGTLTGPGISGPYKLYFDTASSSQYYPLQFYSMSAQPPSSFRPAKVDMSGIFLGFQASAFF